MVSPDELGKGESPLGEGESPQGMLFLGHSGDHVDTEEDIKQSSAQEGEQVHVCWVHLTPQASHSLCLIKRGVFQSYSSKSHGNKKKKKNSTEDGDFSLISCLTFHAAFFTEDIHVF